jgi:biotin carboxylase
VLLLMASQTYRASAFLAAARDLGIAVTVASERSQALAFVDPAGHLTVDLEHPESAVAAIVAFALKHPIGAVVAVDDDGSLIAALAAARLGLSHATAGAVRAARDKHLMREQLARAGLPGPWFARYTTADDPVVVAGGVPMPCVLKPTLLGASRGVIRADDRAAFVAAFRRTAAIVDAVAATLEPDGRRSILVEEFMAGAEVAVEGVLTHGALRVLALFDKPDPLDGPFFEETIYVTPSRLEANARAAIVEATQRAAAAIGLDHGPLHAELRWDGERALVVEIAPRSIGGLCSRALRFHPGGTLESVLLRHALGESVEYMEREPVASGVMMIPIPAAGVLIGVRGVDAARAVPDVEDVRLTIPIGDRLVPLPEGARYLGFIFARAVTPDAVEAALRAAHRALEFEIDEAGRGAGAAPPGGAHS